ncbi:MAG TPA: NAD(P)-binding domain-containing protein, partial [Methylibium sp.]|nr:NAD(P)-binding domain-containing protein [Methylibium sp.]
MNLENTKVAFIGGGNMAGALIGGLRRSGVAAERILVVEPWAEQRAKLLQDFGVSAAEQAGPALAAAGLVVWAVKPQLFKAAAAPCAAHVRGAAQLSVMAGIRSDAIVAASGSERVVRAMPNTPALIGRGIAGLYARPGV